MKDERIVKVFGIVVAFAAFLCMTVAISKVYAHAEEYDKLEYKTVNDFDELFEQFNTDYVFESVARADMRSNGYDKIWFFDIDEPGWFIASTFNDIDLTYYIYSNSMFTLTNDYVHTEYKIGGAIYSNRCEDICFLNKGRYYFQARHEWSNSASYGDNIVRLRFFFLPASAALTVDEIKYNDDYSAAMVDFTPLSDKIRCLKLYDRELKNYNEMHDDKTAHCILRRSWLSPITDTSIVTSEDDILDYLSNGFEIKKNGTYTIEIEFSDEEYYNYHVAAYFVIDKIGAEAEKVEAKSVKLSKKKASLKVGECTTLKATLKPKNVTDKTVTWKSSNTKVATVDENGKVTAKKKGTCTITATTSNGKKAKCKITVKK